MTLTHLDEQGRAHMVDVGHKADTQREAVARGRILMKPDTLALIQEQGIAKGDRLDDHIFGARIRPDIHTGNIPFMV